MQHCWHRYLVLWQIKIHTHTHTSQWFSFILMNEFLIFIYYLFDGDKSFFFSFILFKCVFMCVYEHTYGNRRSQKPEAQRLARIPLDLELEATVSFLTQQWVLGIKFESSASTISTLFFLNAFTLKHHRNKPLRDTWKRKRHDHRMMLTQKHQWLPANVEAEVLWVWHDPGTERTD